jgi:hypothetical protein
MNPSRDPFALSLSKGIIALILKDFDGSQISPLSLNRSFGLGLNGNYGISPKSLGMSYQNRRSRYEAILSLYPALPERELLHRVYGRP